ncbi:MAG TPA: hypothetical protein VK670_04430, partial [Silvibacterium sp.]|nr:hypothetical protein [Silvibacterium sp.]
MVCAAVSKVHEQIKASGRPDIPLIWSEFNATYANEQPITDSTYEAPWMADTIRQCDGKVDIMSYWSFSDVFEEQGVVKRPFYGGYGIVAERGIPKPAFRAFEILHDLGDERVAEPENDVLVTRRKDGTLVIALWNLIEPQATGPDKTFTLDIKGARGSRATIRRVDATHGDTLDAWKQMGSPRYPTQAQIAALKKASEIGQPETVSLKVGQLTVTVPQRGLAVVEIR